MIPALRSTARTLIATALLLLVGCTGITVDTTPTEKFEQGNYKSYSWLGAPIENTGGSKDPLYVIDPALRSAVDRELADKGYQRVDTGGDFTVTYQFKNSMADGALNSTAAIADNRYPVPTGGALINRGADQALVDNAYALSGAREMNSILLQFSDSESQSLVWAGAMSKLVENANQNAGEKMKKGIKSAVAKVLRKLPNAN